MLRPNSRQVREAEEGHRLQEIRQRREAAEAKRRRRDDLAALRTRLASLGSIANAQQRGLALEPVLNDLFKIDGLNVREAFTIRNEGGQVQEQIDGLIALDGRPILVEAKWLSTPIGQKEIARHLVRVYSRAEVMALFVSSSPFTEPAISECRTALSQRVIVLAESTRLCCCWRTRTPAWPTGCGRRSWRRPSSGSRSRTRRCARARRDDLCVPTVRQTITLRFIPAAKLAMVV